MTVVSQLELAEDMRKRSIVGLDLIRFFAALLVVFYHIFFFRNLAGPDPSEPWVLRQMWFGWVGVEIFFVISGCVIAFSAQSLSAGAFARHRIVRLYPTVWICASLKLVLILAFIIRLQPGMWLRYLKTLALWPHGSLIDAAYWTLQVEIMFYALIGVILATGKYRHLTAIMGVIGVGSTVFWLLFTAAGPLGLPVQAVHILDAMAVNQVAGLLLIHQGCFFAIGVFTYVLYREGKGSPTLYTMFALCSIGGLGEINHTVLLKNSIYMAAGHSIAGQSGPWLAMVVWGVAVIAILLAMRFNTIIAGKLRPALGTVRFIGLMTFPLYLVNGFGTFLAEGAIRLGVWVNLAEAAGLVFALGLSALITAYLEPPLRAALRSLLLPVKTAAPQASGASVAAPAAR